VEFARLRELLHGPIVGLSNRGTHEALPSICEELGLLAPDDTGTKRERMEASYSALPDAELPRVAECLLRSFPPSAALRNELQDLLWADAPGPEIPKRFRREVAQALTPEDLYPDSERFDELLERLWIIDDDNDDTFAAFLLGDGYRRLRAEIQRHVHRNPGDWPVEYLFDRLGAYDASDRRFALFLEGLTSADLRPDVREQLRFVKLVNEPLRKCGVELRETGNDGGYPIFKVVSLARGVSGHPKNLIFASQTKPDLRFRDAVNNDIEIVTNADKVLVYERPIPLDEGLRWRELQDWWADLKRLSEEEAKMTLYKRLLQSLPSDSPPQRLFFKTYFQRFGRAIPLLPALLPEVWLHWDPRTVQERGPDALLRFRMDFLMLLPSNVRVVIEVDGKHHYADNNGIADTSKYAAMMAADRELRLAGYDVYHFGASELWGDRGRTIVTEFLERLFRLYRVNVPV
jgi:very-short-patch-repair endonuclease